ncbi:family 16 glycosylhydrolase [Gaetbulibacter sp. M240]|uniref:family 16 glycosylhydrolase n=1 Tax=Gaetbulibacter sp. M240 TaxID=3126511 RepID=UPI00374F7729
MSNFTKKTIKNYLHLIFLTFGMHLALAQCPNIVWSDEFSGNSLDLTKWNYQLGDGCAEGICGWGNNELQSYQEANVTVSNGTLKITARKERNKGSQYTSGRINSKNKGDFTYGRFEASIKLPYGDGLWPAFWMLSTDEPYGTWPKSGEIDIMESVASNPNEVFGTIHYGDLYPNNQYQGNEYILKDANFPDAFHEFAIEWEPGEIRWYVDGILYSKKQIADVSPYNWPFDNDFHFLLNVAVGGSLGGPVDNTMLPSSMEVDYVRVYDGFKPHFTGEAVVSNQATGVVYSIENLAPGTSVNWRVPSDATIVSGQGTASVTVDFGSFSGRVSASFNDGCSEKNYSNYIEVEPPYIKEFSFENFDDPGTATLASATGDLTEVSNPSPDVVNSSNLSSAYVRNSSEQYDLITYSVSNITDASNYVDKSKKFYLDVYTTAPVGTEIILQLETPLATASNYPSGRHSRYMAKVETNNAWQRLPFTLLDRPDPSTPDGDVSKMILLFASNTFTGDTYYFDNLDSYAADNGSTGNQAPTISISDPLDGATFDLNTTITISANTSDPDGTVTQVEFFSNGVSLGIDSTAPFSRDFTVPLGDSNLTAEATDDFGAKGTSTSITIIGQATRQATSMQVASVTLGSASAGRGQKYGTASVTIEDNNGNVVPNATVTGTFSGTFSEEVTATTDSNGVAVLQTSLSAKGTLTINICIDNVSHASLVYEAANNAITCTGGTAKLASKTKVSEDPINGLELRVFPNPASTAVYIRTFGFATESTINVYNTSGQRLLSKMTDGDVSSINVAEFPSGLYFIKIRDESSHEKTAKFMKL